jgi:Uma2 family endonuclease
MATMPATRATLDDLAREPGKAELVGGRIVHFIPTGHWPNQVAGRIFRSLAGFVDQLGRGFVYTDNMGFVVPELPSGRESFSPDAAYHPGPPPAKRMKFIEGPPAFAAEVRSEGDYGPAAGAEIAAKRADYFAAGTSVVWDVDPIAELVHIYRSADPLRVTTYGRGQEAEAEAEPAVPGWRVAVDWLFA